MTIKQEYAKNLKRVKQFIHRAEKRGYTFSPNVIPQTPKRITRKSVEKLVSLTPENLYSKATYTSPITGAKIAGTEGRKEERSRAAKKAAETVRAKRSVSGKAIAKKVRPKKSLSSYRTDFHGDKAGGEKPTEKESDEEPTESGIVLSNLLRGLRILRLADSMITNWKPLSNWTESLIKAKTQDRNTVAGILKGALDAYGEKQLAERLQYEATDVISLLDEILYGSGDTEGNFKDGRTKVNADINRFATILKGSPLDMYESIGVTREAEENDYEDE